MGEGNSPINFFQLYIVAIIFFPLNCISENCSMHVNFFLQITFKSKNCLIPRNCSSS